MPESLCEGRHDSRIAKFEDLWEDHFLAEIIDPVTGAVRAPGEEGELVFTSLTNEAMPVIRYRTRDMTRLLPGSITAMRRLARISAEVTTC